MSKDRAQTAEVARSREFPGCTGGYLQAATSAIIALVLIGIILWGWVRTGDPPGGVPGAARLGAEELVFGFFAAISLFGAVHFVLQQRNGRVILSPRGVTVRNWRGATVFIPADRVTGLKETSLGWFSESPGGRLQLLFLGSRGHPGGLILFNSLWGTFPLDRAPWAELLAALVLAFDLERRDAKSSWGYEERRWHCRTPGPP